jgi:hypothetical protein
LAAHETRLAQDEAWYAKQLQALQDGPAATTLAYDRGMLRLDKTQRPALLPLVDRNGQPIPSARGLAQRENQVRAELAAQLQQLDKLARREKELTLQLTGDGAGLKGLRPELADERQERQKSLDEQESLEWVLYNRLVETDLMRQRLQALQARLQELKGVRITSRQP